MCRLFLHEEHSMETGATDAEVRQMIALHVDDRDDEARKLAGRIADRNDEVIRSMMEKERRCARRTEDRHRAKLATRAMVMGTLAGMVLAGWILVVGIWQFGEVEPSVLAAAAVSFACGALGAFLGWWVAR